ncbi:hypothetical protein GCM10010344_71080 [Streptomyces bluensis]|nr:hypothetical protein GCM10010344_71080 [Streptomyces bluensis]
MALGTTANGLTPNPFVLSLSVPSPTGTRFTSRPLHPRRVSPSSLASTFGSRTVRRGSPSTAAIYIGVSRDFMNTMMRKVLDQALDSGQPSILIAKCRNHFRLVSGKGGRDGRQTSCEYDA